MKSIMVIISSYMYDIWCVYHVQKGETPLLRAINGGFFKSESRYGRCKVVKYFVQKKKIDITQFSQVCN